MKKIGSSIALIIFTAIISVAQKYEVNTDTRSIVLNYPDSTIKCEILNTDKSITCDNNLVYFWYSTDKINTNRGGIGGKTLNGTYHVTSKSGSLLVQGSFKLGLKDQVWKYWYSNGELKKVETWNKGKLNGIQVNYSHSGKIQNELNFKDGLLNGKCVYHSADTIITREYKNGNEIIKEDKAPLFERIFKKKDKEKVDEVSVQPVKTESGDEN
ncbi:MAG: hypothetical protein A2041_10680 [Bacteroidetes bacterium GWA2_31_9b]|nr:MAG: hypothetical protein A2041_10680 [Bacteroidetes bacterium GWA2_31_9b]